MPIVTSTCLISTRSLSPLVLARVLTSCTTTWLPATVGSVTRASSNSCVLPDVVRVKSPPSVSDNDDTACADAGTARTSRLNPHTGAMALSSHAQNSTTSAESIAEVIASVSTVRATEPSA
jgi:hypothetical protein